MAELWTSWPFWYAVGAAIVAVAAALLLTVLWIARGIEREAARALAALREVEARTRVLWGLGPARRAMAEARGAAEAIADDLEGLGSAAQGEPGREEAAR